MSIENISASSVLIPATGVTLQGILTIPLKAKGIVVFSHGSGSGRLSPRNTFVARVLSDHGIATLLLDLLTEKEDASYKNRFNIPLLTERLSASADWIGRSPETKNLPIGIFGASTGAASALQLAARLDKKITAVVSRGGRPDLAGDALPDISAPTLLIVGGNDDEVLMLNKKAFARLRCEKKLTIIPDATHLFEEPGALEAVAKEAAEWFDNHFRTVR